MKGHGAKFDRKQEEAIAALLTQRNIEEAARVAGVAGTTLVRWLQIPEFQEAYREARRAAFSQSIARLQQASSAPPFRSWSRLWWIRMHRRPAGCALPTWFWSGRQRRLSWKIWISALRNSRQSVRPKVGEHRAIEKTG